MLPAPEIQLVRQGAAKVLDREMEKDLERKLLERSHAAGRATGPVNDAHAYFDNL